MCLLPAASRSLKFVHGHRYGIIGENGVGKSTLLRRLAKQSIPGVPLHFRFGYVQQEIPVIDNVTVLDYILRGVASMESLESMLENLKEDEAGLEALLEVMHAVDRSVCEGCLTRVWAQKETDSDKLSELAEELCLLSEKIEDMEAKIAQQRAEASDTEKSGRTELTRAYLESLVRASLVAASFRQQYVNGTAPCHRASTRFPFWMVSGCRSPYGVCQRRFLS